ncbi:MAG: SdpI family protein [Lachnospiraceae bacterium]|nr:SdpI family protein [Lachnospiraceae bacterium]
MGFWIFMLIMNMLLPTTMLGFGWIFLHKAPKSINWAYGYRTAMSTKNQDTWDFAHQYAGKLWFKWGKWLLVISVVVMLLLIGQSEAIISAVGGVLCMVELVPLVYVIVPTERALKQTFDSKGNRRKKKPEVQE